jgi:membrane associated rhomboid family serine protease
MARYGGSSYQFGGYHLSLWVKRLLIANFGVFVLTLALPWLVPYLAFQPSEVMFRPWAVLTYMFTHGGFWHIFFNMLALFFFGPPIEERWGSREFIKYYLICGLGGAELSLLFAFIYPVVGASAAVYGIMLAFAMLWPDMPIYIWGIFPVKAKWLVIFLAFVSIFSAFSASPDGVAHLAHLGGFAAGFIYIKLDNATGNPFEKMRKLVSRRRFKVVPGAPAAKKEPPKLKRRDEDRALDDVDRVLDKISTQGMASLTPEERRLLDEVSRRYRQN